jgi:hypothetical protein
MTEEVVPANRPDPVFTGDPFITPSPMGMPAKPDKPARTFQDPDRFLSTAKQMAVDNYNRSRDAERSPELQLDQVFIVWYTKVLGNWRALVGSPVIKGLMWDVTYNGHRSECYVVVFKKLNEVRVSLPKE